MPNYFVTVTETVTYRVPVTADNANDARDTAIDVIVNAEDMNDFFVSVDDRAAGIVTLNTCQHRDDGRGRCIDCKAFT